jgi:hypothetical protein
MIKSRRMRSSRHVARKGEKRRCRRVDNIKMNLAGAVDSIGLNEDRDKYRAF